MRRRAAIAGLPPGFERRGRLPGRAARGIAAPPSTPNGDGEEANACHLIVLCNHFRNKFI